MVVVSYSGKEINGKLVYYGPGLSGKTTNLEYIYQSVPSSNRGKMVSMKTRTERTLFFDFLPVDLGEMGGFKTRFLLYTVPGQVYYNATRKLVLRGVDAVIFVADSERGKMDENIESLQNLRDNLAEYGLDLDKIPWVIQYNKRDLEDVYTIEELEQALNPTGVPYFEAVATTGPGVFETFRGIAKLLLQKLSKEIKLGEAKMADSRSAPAAGPAREQAETPPAPPSMNRPPSREIPYRPGRGDTPSQPMPRLSRTPAPEPAPAPREEEPFAVEPVSSGPVTPPDTSDFQRMPPPDSREFGRPVRPPSREFQPPVTPESREFEPPARPDSREMEAVERSDSREFEPEPRSESREFESPTRSDSREFEPVNPPVLSDEPEPAAEEVSPEPVEAYRAPDPEPEPVTAEADEDFADEQPAVEPDEPVEAEPVAEESPQEAPVRKLEPVLPDVQDRYGDQGEDGPGFWGRLFNRNRKDSRSEYRPLPPRQARVSEVKIPAVAGSGETTPVFIEKRIQVPITLGPEEIVRGATLRLVLEVQVEASQDKSEAEDREHRAA